MASEKLNFLVVENATDACEGIIRRMEKFEKWTSLGYCKGVKEAIEKIQTSQPQLLFLDWSLNGGSGFEILQRVQNITGYNPYIIFNTGYQKDNPEIPQDIINHYKVDKYLVKPIWENLTQNLPFYLQEAEAKSFSSYGKPKMIWVEDVRGTKVPVYLENLICICQDPEHPRSRIFYINNPATKITVSLQWQKCYDILRENDIDFFITKSRSHLVTRAFIEKFEKPFVRMKNFPAKIEVVKETVKEFQEWLIRK